MYLCNLFPARAWVETGINSESGQAGLSDEGSERQDERFRQDSSTRATPDPCNIGGYCRPRVANGLSRRKRGRFPAASRRPAVPWLADARFRERRCGREQDDERHGDERRHEIHYSEQRGDLDEIFCPGIAKPSPHPLGRTECESRNYLYAKCCREFYGIRGCRQRRIEWRREFECLRNWCRRRTIISESYQ